MKRNSQITKGYAILPIIVLALIIFASCGKNIKTDNSNPATEEKTTDGAYKEVDVMPVFPGGDTALLSYIAKNTIYPEQAKVNAIQGKVVVRFMVKEDGSVSDVTILQSANTDLNTESIRVVSSLPKFTPGLLKGKAVPVWFMVPIDFKLK
jgi:periplasmic protein TonB